MRINRHRNMEPTEAERAKRNAELNAAALAHVNSLIESEYRRLGAEPIYAGDVLVSPGLVAKRRGTE